MMAIFVTLSDGGDELCAPCHRVGAVPRHGPDDCLHDALLPTLAARDEKRSHGLLPDGLLRWLCFR